MTPAGLSNSAVLLDELEVLDRDDHVVEGFAAVVGDLDFLHVAVVADDGPGGAGGPVADSVDLLDRSFEGDDVDFSDCLLLRTAGDGILRWAPQISKPGAESQCFRVSRLKTWRELITVSASGTPRPGPPIGRPVTGVPQSSRAPSAPNTPTRGANPSFLKER
jgi:hypothetical protein